MEPLLLVRADASPRIGTGHVMRTLALAQAWRRAGGRAEFLCAEIPGGLEARLAREGMGCRRLAAEPGSPEDMAELRRQADGTHAAWIVADGYAFGAEYQAGVRAPTRGLLVLDDYGHAGHYAADLVLNQNAGAAAGAYRSRGEGTKLLLGTTYALLREEFLRAALPEPREGGPVLVTFGGSDPENVTGRVVEALRPLSGVRAIVVAGAGNPHLAALEAALVAGGAAHLELRRDVTDMAALMRDADLAVTAAGSTSWELAYFGIPSIQIVIAENQAGIARALSEAGAAINLGDRHAVSVPQIRQAVQRLAGDPVLRFAMRMAARQLVDGRGADRVVKEMRDRPLAGAPL